MKSLVRFSFSIVFTLLISTFFVQAQNCVVPDNGTGTVTLPPEGCEYMSPDEAFEIIEGLPAGTTIVLTGPLWDFFCCPFGCPGCSLPIPPGICELPGGTLGGDGECFTSTLDLLITGTGELEGFIRNLSVPVFAEVHTAPRNPGDPIQEFNTDMFRFQGEVFGDPDFTILRITAGTDFGLPSPGHTTLTQLPDGDFAVDSFFDITYEIEFEGAPGSVLEGSGGTTTGIIRLETGGMPALNDIIDPGANSWTVPSAGFEFGSPELPPIPSDFFEPGSDPFNGIVEFEGGTLEPPFPDYHTLINRITPANLPSPYPSTDMIDTEIIELSLVGTTPITVTYFGGMDPQLWEVEVVLSVNPTPIGLRQITKNDLAGGTFSDNPLVVSPKFIFTRSSNPLDKRELDTGLEGINPIEFSALADYPWEQDGNDFKPVGTDPYPLSTIYGINYLNMIPYIVSQDEFDWGDAPDEPYPTLAGNNGAYHFIDNVTYLGNTIDAEIDGLQDPLALGDDNDGSDDEDGVSFVTWPLIPGEYAYIGVTIPASAAGAFLDGWIDFNGNGSWFDLGDQIFFSTPVVAGTSTMSFYVPGNAVANITSFARFRLSNTFGLPFDGFAQNGEVEDYSVDIGESLEIKWVQLPDRNVLGYHCHDSQSGELHIADDWVCTGGEVTNFSWWGNYELPSGPIMGFRISIYDNDGSGLYNKPGAMLWTTDAPLGANPGEVNETPSGLVSNAGEIIYFYEFDLPEPFGQTPETVYWFDLMAISVDPGNNVMWRWQGNDEPLVPDNPVQWDLSGYIAQLNINMAFVVNSNLVQTDLDFGDAPDGSYPTLLNSNGARHVVIQGIQLGNSIDAEPDGQPDVQALGDDLDLVYGPPVNDDDDGVQFTSAILQGQIATITVTTLSPALFLNVWIDYNQNGSWAETNEHIFIDHLLPNFSNNLSFNVPAGTITGQTYMRFRYSGALGLSYDGLAPDGEVEDYLVTIGPITGGTIMDPDPTSMFVQNEISIEWAPARATDPAIILAAYNDHPYPGGPGLGVSYSLDDGTTWSNLQLQYPANPFGAGNFVDAFDPTVTIDGNGDLFVAHISTDYQWGIGPASGLFVHKSTDRGVNWLNPVQVAANPNAIGSPDVNFRFNDRCQITADINSASPYYNNLYIVEIKDRGWNMPLPYSDIYFTRSTDGGATWSTQVILNNNTNMGNMPVPAVAPDGTIYVCWMDYNVITGGTGTIYMDISTDGGVTWLTTDITVVPTVNLPPLNLNGGTDALAKGAAVIGVSPFNSQHIYISYAERVAGTSDEGDIMFIRSSDAGATWTTPLKVNDDGTTNDQVMPWLDVKPNGTIDIAWYDRRNDPQDYQWDVYIAMSTDGGSSFLPNMQVNSTLPAVTPFTPSGDWMGEYLGLTVNNTTAYVGFTSSITDINGDVYFDKIDNPSIDIDFGDADDGPYPTLLINNGASHFLDGATFLGASVDPEPDGQPDPNALGDDNDGNDDEDGVTFDWPLAIGNPCKITVNASVNNGLFSGWVDFDGNGSWADPGEQVFADIPLVSGNNSLNFMVPPNASAGLITYARFRFSTQPGLSFDGQAQDGEVEDYEVEISETGDYKWVQYPGLNLPGLHAHDYVNADGNIESIVLADDWKCHGGLVTDIHWWGNYELDALGQEIRGSHIDHFHVSIHANDPTGSCLPLDPEITGFDIPFSALTELNTGVTNIEGCSIYLYEYILDIPFEQDSGTIYWVDITAFSVDANVPAIWRWQESMRSYYPILCGAADKTEPGVLPWSTIQWLVNPPYKYSDMAFIITSQEIEEMDYGDANDPNYPTLLASDGARHLLDGVTWLGTSIDPEYNGQPDPNALGDDNDGNDDEDGVTFTSQLIRGNTTTVDVEASVDGYLDAWLDFNGNGIWEAGEIIFSMESLNPGINNLSFNVPSGAIPGITYARFRFSSYGGLLVTGLATDGEVEDYEIEIKEVPNKWVQYPDPNLPGLHAHDYDFQPAYGQIILADDWICQGGWVTDIHWWGNYEEDVNGNEIRGAGIEYFHLSIHNLDATGCIPQDPEIWGVDVPFSALTEISTGLINLEGCEIYLYEYILEEPFPQIEGTHYWLDITAVCTDPVDPAYWRWQESSRTLPPILCAAAEKTLPNPGLWNPIVWANETSSDMAFMITSALAPEIDMGDAMDPTYPTLLANNGAAHIIDQSIILGTSIDSEPDGQPDPNALGDDNDGNNDEDGINFMSSFSPGGSVMIDINVSADGFINAWVDYNGNGSWAEANEQILNDQAVVAGSNFLILPVPVNANVGYTYARFRYNSSGGLDFTGLAQDGEVEDYEVYIEGNLDFGDAPDQAFPAYPTLLASNGARHLIDPNVYLGNSIDMDSDGQPDMLALGDDNDGNDDEDGVLIPFMLGHGQMTTITVIASVDGFLNGWIDYNSSGNWTESDEHIFIDQPITLGNNILTINIPTTSVKGTTYARFRFSTSPGLSYEGQAPDGEVEDYQVEIGDPGKWLQNPDLTDNGMDIDATFKLDSPDLPMILADDFECTVTGPLTRIEIWGSWLNDYFPFYEDHGAVIFTLSIHKDIPAEESTTGYSMPGDVLWWRTFDPIEFMFEPAAMNLTEGWYNPATGWYIFPGDTECWKYIFPLSEDDFIQQGTADEPVIYWLDVQAEPLDQDPMCRFGWKTSIDHWNDNAVWGIGSEPYPGPWEELIYPPDHPLQGEAIDMAFAIFGDENPFILLDLTVLLEGPYDGTNMSTTVNSANLIPLNQPYSTDPLAKWYYTGTESVMAIPNADIVDWILIELRDATSPATANGASMIDQKAAFILKDGSVVASDGFSLLKSYATFAFDPYIVVWHRNHLGILSNNPLNNIAPGLYSYDFTTGFGQAYLNGQTNLSGSIYGMFGGDARPDEIIQYSDKSIWESDAGTTGYKASDFNMDTQVDNKDKDDIWVPNIGKGTKVPN